MPNLTYTNPTLTDPASKTEVQENFDNILTLVNGGLDNDNFVALGGLETSKLVARDYEFLVPLTAIAWGTAGQVAAVCAIPGSTTDGAAYTVLSAEYFVLEAGGSGSPAFDVDFGYYSGGVWQQTSIIINAEVFTANTGETGSCTINTSTISLSNNQNYFRLLVDTAGTTVLASIGANEMLNVTLKLRRTDGLRST